MAIIINIDVMLAKRKMNVTELADKVGITMSHNQKTREGSSRVFHFALSAKSVVAFTIAVIALTIVVARRWLVSLLDLLLLFRGPIVVAALLAERSHLRQQSDRENHRH